MDMDIGKIILLLAPIILINYGLVIYCIIDILKYDRNVKGGNKLIWILVVALINMFGWIIYLMFGREE